MAQQAMDLRVVALDRVYSGVPAEMLSRWAAEGRIAAGDLVRPHGSEAWVRVTEISWLAASLPLGSLPAAAAVGQEGDGDDLSEADLDGATGWLPSRPRAKAEEVEMDMTPMIDVTFLLLIFFMLTNSLANPAPIEVPQAAYGRGVTPDGKQIILIDDRGRYYLGEGTREENISPSLEALVDEVRRNAAGVDAPLDVIITAHKQSKHVQLRELVDRLGSVPNLGQVMLGVEEKTP